MDLTILSDSELDSESDEGKNYRYEHKYDTLLSKQLQAKTIKP